MQSYLVKTRQGDLTLKEMSVLVNLPETFFIPEVNWLTVSPEKDSIGISQIKEMIKWLIVYKADSGGKVVVIHRAHLMTIEAQNALLKNLEEPGANNRLILVVINPDMLLDTIVSRCQYINLVKSITQQPTVDPQKIVFIQNLINMSAAKAFIEIDKAGLTKSGAETGNFLLDIIAVLKSNSFPLRYKYRLIKSAVDAIALIDQNVNSRIVLESFLLDLAAAH